ncbi:hypothetical protein [Acidiferrobacter sp.]|uniref:hypothetical protein n=1 Tax=Acidiferrobacter sp. TaxID=1872107 RepID=UPI002627CA69|nr:hypothetical protein [Acidiferrobacter sp.]
MPKPSRSLIAKRASRSWPTRIADKYGTLLTIPMVAAELHRSEKAMHFAFSSWSCRETPWVRALLAGKIKMGRRVFFPADVVAAVMLQGDDISL